jgi:hypothetical protein
MAHLNAAPPPCRRQACANWRPRRHSPLPPSRARPGTRWRETRQGSTCACGARRRHAPPAPRPAPTVSAAHCSGGKNFLFGGWVAGAGALQRGGCTYSLELRGERAGRAGGHEDAHGAPPTDNPPPSAGYPRASSSLCTPSVSGSCHAGTYLRANPDCASSGGGGAAGEAPAITAKDIAAAAQGLGSLLQALSKTQGSSGSGGASVGSGGLGGGAGGLGGAVGSSTPGRRLLKARVRGAWGAVPIGC